MDAAHCRDDGMCIPQVFAGKGYKTTLDNIPCRFYEEAPPTKEVPLIGKLKETLVWDSNYGGYVEQRNKNPEPKERIERPFSKEYQKLEEQFKNGEITLGEWMVKVLDVPLYEDEE